MDMNEILNQWDKMQREQKTHAGKHSATNKNSGVQQSAKKANADHVVSGGKQNGAASVSKQDSTTVSSNQNSIKKSNVSNAPKINPMIAWMNRYGVMDKDKMLDEAAERNKMESHTYLREMKAEAVIDLHGLTADEATAKLTSFVDGRVRVQRFTENSNRTRKGKPFKRHRPSARKFGTQVYRV